jgi:TRAP-type C4-dicarboxylate transport system substrate-binding protein
MRKLLIGLLLTIFGIACADAQPINAKFATAYPPQYPPSRGAEMLQSEFAKAGIARLDVLPAGAVGRPNELLNLLRQGVVEMALVPTPFLVEIDKNFAIFSLPFAFRDIGYVVRFQESEAGKKLLRSLDGSNLKGLAYWSVGMTQLFSKRPVREADDFKGLKVASTGNPLANSVMQTLGANVAQIGGGEIYAALDRGVVDASETTLIFANLIKLGQVQKFMNVTNQQYQGAVLVASNSFWTKLPADAQRRAVAIVEQVTRQVDELAIDGTAMQVEALQKDGLQISIPQAAAFNSWYGVTKQAWPRGGGDPQVLLVAGGTEGGGDSCGPGVCRCTNKTCSRDCCRRPK